MKVRGVQGEPAPLMRSKWRGRKTARVGAHVRRDMEVRSRRARSTPSAARVQRPAFEVGGRAGVGRARRTCEVRRGRAYWAGWRSNGVGTLERAGWQSKWVGSVRAFEVRAGFRSRWAGVRSQRHGFEARGGPAFEVGVRALEVGEALFGACADGHWKCAGRVSKGARAFEAGRRAGMRSRKDGRGFADAFGASGRLLEAGGQGLEVGGMGSKHGAGVLEVCGEGVPRARARAGMGSRSAFEVRSAVRSEAWLRSGRARIRSGRAGIRSAGGRAFEVRARVLEVGEWASEVSGRVFERRGIRSGGGALEVGGQAFEVRGWRGFKTDAFEMSGEGERQKYGASGDSKGGAGVRSGRGYRRSKWVVADWRTVTWRDVCEGSGAGPGGSR
ncbi:hypothetical protein B0H14DRAFT_3651296 [Mycena olivaceomarginata]|nr:hypothetical protein B0H14DRAFT_3651296 [Mycena olivaceomarginata]